VICALSLEGEFVRSRLAGFLGSCGGRPSNDEGVLFAQEVEKLQNDSGKI
jgi:hypothetical protein